MNDPSVHDVLAGSLDRHGRAVGTPEGDLGDVLRRVDRRRARRRSTAVIGSTLAVAAGAAGIVLVAAPADAPAPGDGDATGAAGSWGCSGFLSSDDIADYYVSCEPFPGVVRPSAPVLPPLTSVVAMTLVPSTTAPFAITASPSTTTTTTTTTIPIGEFQHVVVEGDYLSGIAARYGVTPGELVAVNGWPDGIEHSLQIGDVVAVPYPIATLPPPTTAGSSAVSSPPVCESGPVKALVTVPCDAPQVSTTTTTTTTMPPLPAPDAAFRCTGPLGGDLVYSYYLSCEPVAWDAVPDPVVPTTVAFTPAFVTAPPTLPPTVTTAPVSPMEQLYTVVAGDSLSSIAELYGISLQILANYNAWAEGVEHPLFPGDVVKIPPGSRIP